MSKNLVIGAGTGYSYKELSPFLHSLCQTDFKGDICLIVHHNLPVTEEEKLKKAGVILYKVLKYEKRVPDWILQRRFSRLLYPIHRMYSSVVKALASKGKEVSWIGKTSSFFLSIACSRYYYYYDFIKSASEQYDKILLSDVRDVVFQKNPFEYPLENRVLFALEDETNTIADENVNSRWIRDMFGEQVLQKIKDNPISCSGTTIGARQPLLEYLEKMIIAMAYKTHRISGRYNYDQAAHNYLIWTNQVQRFDFAKNNKGPILTMLTAQENNFNFNNGRLYNDDNSLIPVIHQYDWFPGLKKDLFEKLQIA